MDLLSLTKRRWFLKQRKAQLEESLKEVNKELQSLTYMKMPEAMEQAEIDKCQYDLDLSPVTMFYNAGREKEVSSITAGKFTEWMLSNQIDEIAYYNLEPQKVTVFETMKPSHKGGNNEQTHDWLRESGNDSLIKETVNARALDSLVKELLENYQELPDWLEAKMIPTTSIRKR